MNTLESHSTTSPYNQTDECAKFTIDDLTSQYIFSNIATVGFEYTLSFWIQSDAAGSISVCGETISTTSKWSQHIIVFTADSVDISFQFDVAGTYYFYHSQLELGNTPSSWSPAPEDTEEDISDVKSTADVTAERLTVAESQIQQLSDSISTLVRDADGQSLMTQTADGWVFSTSTIDNSISSISGELNELQETTGSTAETVSGLQKAVDELGTLAEYVKISTLTSYKWDRHNIDTIDGYALEQVDDGRGSITNPFSGQIYKTITIDPRTGDITLSEPYDDSDVISVANAGANYKTYPYFYDTDGKLCKLINAMPVYGSWSFWTDYMVATAAIVDVCGDLIETVSSSISDTYPDYGMQDGYWYIKGEEVVEPCIELGEGDSDFKLLITNTQILFMEGSGIPVYISNQAAHMQKAIVDHELRVGKFVWNIRSNGNMGLQWKG